MVCLFMFHVISIFLDKLDVPLLSLEILHQPQATAYTETWQLLLPTHRPWATGGSHTCAPHSLCYINSEL